MPDTVQTYIAGEIRKTAEALETALDRLPEDKRAWSPMDAGRTALDQVAECALINGYIAQVLRAQTWPNSIDITEFPTRKNALAENENEARALLKQNAGEAAAAIAGTPDEALGREIQTPFGAMSLQKIGGMAAWNMGYHEGQIHYIASLIGCLH